MLELKNNEEEILRLSSLELATLKFIMREEKVPLRSEFVNARPLNRLVLKELIETKQFSSGSFLVLTDKAKQIIENFWK